MFESQELAKGTIVLTVEMRKSWSHKPTYWVSLVSVPVGPLVLWYAVRHWKFWKREESKEVKGESVSERQLSAQRALTVMEQLIEYKLKDSDYVVHNLKIENVKDDLKGVVDAFCSSLQKMLPATAQRVSDKEGVEIVFHGLAEEAAKSEDQANTFAAAVKRRKREAKW